MRFVQSAKKQYKIVKELGKGSSATVYLAYDNKFDKAGNYPLSLKVLNSSGYSPNLRKFYYLLDKANIPRMQAFVGFEHAMSSLVVVNKYIEGISLDVFLRHKKEIELNWLIYWYLECLDSLWHLKAKGLAHGDISGSNIILQPNGEICLIDPEPSLNRGVEGVYFEKKGFEYDQTCLNTLFNRYAMMYLGYSLSEIEMTSFHLALEKQCFSDWIGFYESKNFRPLCFESLNCNLGPMLEVSTAKFTFSDYEKAWIVLFLLVTIGYQFWPSFANA